MNKETIEAIMSKLQQKAIGYKVQGKFQKTYNEEGYYSYVLFDFIQNTRKENANLKQALNEIREVIEHSKGMDFQKEKYILQIIDNVDINNE